MSATMCKCGHPKDKHFNGTGTCMCLTSASSFALDCECHKYEPFMSTERVSDEELAQGIIAQAFSTDLVQNHFLMSVCRELQQRRETDRMVKSVWRDWLDVDGPMCIDKMDKAISEILP